MVLRPPTSWADVFQNEQLVPFFFELHRSVRQNPDLAQHTLACIVQLANVTGSVMDAPRGSGGKPIKAEVQPSDLHMRRFCTALVDVFKE